MFQDLNFLHNFENPIFIYELIDPRDNLPKYIGKTNNIKRRYTEHTSKHNLNTKTIKNNWIKKLIKLNLKPKIRIINIAKNNEIANTIEIQKIKEYKVLGFKLKNGTIGGDGKSVKWKLSQFNKICIPVVGMCIKTGNIVKFKSVTDAARKFNIGSGQISFCCKKQKGFLTAAGFKWFYEKDFYALEI